MSVCSGRLLLATQSFADQHEVSEDYRVDFSFLCQDFFQSDEVLSVSKVVLLSRAARLGAYNEEVATSLPRPSAGILKSRHHHSRTRAHPSSISELHPP
jgi:hypothetical protein